MTDRSLLGKISPIDVYSNLEEKVEAILPKVTSSDNGKVLKVISGKWKKANETVELPEFPSSAGTYQLQLVVADGTPTLTWEAVT